MASMSETAAQPNGLHVVYCCAAPPQLMYSTRAILCTSHNSSRSSVMALVESPIISCCGTHCMQCTQQGAHTSFLPPPLSLSSSSKCTSHK